MLEKKDTVCRLCSACCPVLVEVENGRLLRAARKVPTGRATVLPCPKLAAAADIIYAPERLQKPLLRQSRKHNNFSEVSWDTALDLMAERLQAGKERHGAASVAWLRGMAADWGAPWDYANRLLHAFGSPNIIGNGSVCHVAREMANIFTYGAMPVPQPLTAECILIWGKNDLNTAPAAGEAILTARERGAKLIVVDPVATRLARAADIWLPVRPGHDALLALALINEMIVNGWYDKGFVFQFCSGFAELKETAARFPAERVACEIGLEPTAIKNAAQLYATTKPACLIEGNGLDMQLQTFQATRAVSMLRALSGNLDRPGGDLLPQPLNLRDIQLRELLPRDSLAITHDYNLFSTFHANWGCHAQSCLIDAILTEKPYPVKTLIVQAGNPAVTMTDSQRVRKALKKLDFLVVIDLFKTKTTAYADLILPAASCFAETQLNRAYMRNNPVILQNQVVEPYADSWPDWKIIFTLAARLGLQKFFPWNSVEEALDYQLEPTGLTVAQLRSRPAGLRSEELLYEKFRRTGFATPSGKVEFFSQRLADNGFSPVPFADGSWQNPLSYADSQTATDLIAISGARQNCFTHSQYHQIAALTSRSGGPGVTLNPADAAARRIKARDEVRISTPHGEIQMPARISDEVQPGSIIIAWGWGEVDDRYNLNHLTDDSRRDPVTATPANRGFMCRLEKADAAEA
ncbi:MAG: molybdopterin-dependent oxidoreductase [Deltaproteobacteria bacterium]|nr:molybdopterin-dependent oxidoreductase [Deltaproteobacteria bacterium]